MFLLTALLLSAPAQAEDLQVLVPLTVDQVTLQCGSETITRDITSDTARAEGMYRLAFPIRPGRDCDVTMRGKVDAIEQLGTWKCDMSGCRQTSEGRVADMDVPDGQIKVVVSMDTPHRQLELTCPGGYRQRTNITEHSATFTDVPSEECTLLWKGGAPMKYSGLTWGGYECYLVSNTPVCSTR